MSDPDDSDSEPELVQQATEFHSYGEESPTIPEYKAKNIPRPGHMEFTCTMEVFDGQEVVGKHACPTPRATCDAAVADAAWQALMS
jgi:hypothetical protein